MLAAFRSHVQAVFPMPPRGSLINGMPIVLLCLAMMFWTDMNVMRDDRFPDSVMWSLMIVVAWLGPAIADERKVRRRDYAHTGFRCYGMIHQLERRVAENYEWLSQMEIALSAIAPMPPARRPAFLNENKGQVISLPTLPDRSPYHAARRTR